MAYTFADSDLVKIRRHCGYPAFGAAQTGFFSIFYFTHYGQLEYRLQNLSANEAAVVLDYTGKIEDLDDALLSASDNLDTDAAGPWTHNRNEVKQRTRLRDQYRKELCSFLHVPPGPALNDCGGRVIV